MLQPMATFKLMIQPRLLLASLALALAASQSAVAQTGYKIVSHIKIGGAGGWDYLTTDAKARRLYVSHGTEVDVIDLDTEKLVGKIANTKGVHGIAIAPELNLGFTSNGGEGTVTKFSLDTLKEITKLKAGENPDAILYEPSNKRILAFNGRSKDVTVIDAEDNDIEGTIPLGGKPEFAVTDGKGTVWVNIEDKNEVVQFDAKTMQIKNRWPVAPGEEPSALALDKEHHRLFIGCGGNNMMIVMDAQTGKVVAHLPIGKGVDADSFDPSTKMVFSSQGNGTVTVIHEDSADKYSVVETLKTAPRARTMTLDAKTHKLYLPTAEFGPAPEKTADNPRPRPAIKPDTFEIVVLAK